MISMVQPLSAGNAIRLFLEPPAGAVSWRVLKKGSDTFIDIDDASALTVYEGDERVVVDAAYLQNEVKVFYRPFYLMPGGAWQAGPTAHGTPAAEYEEHTTDAMSFVRERLEAGLLVEVQRGNLVNELGYIQVYTAPPAMEHGLRFPLVTVHLENESPAERGIGDDISGDKFDFVTDDWLESEGWLSQVQLTIIGWSLNSDERIELRKAIRRIILSNMPVFDAKGMTQITVSAQDVDAVNGEFGAPVYQVMNSFSCLAPVRVGNRVTPINDIEVKATNG